MINGISYGYIFPNEWTVHPIGFLWRVILQTLREIIASDQQLDGATVTVSDVPTILRLCDERLCWWFSKPGDLIILPHFYTFSPNLIMEQFPEFERVYEMELPPLSIADAMNDIVLLNLMYSVLAPQIRVDQDLQDSVADEIAALVQPGVDDPHGIIFTLGGVTVELDICPETMCWWFRDVDDPDSIYFESSNLLTQGPVANNGPLRIYWPDDDDEISSDEGIEELSD